MCQELRYFVTIAEIAEHAGLKKRSFFRYYADKREVLFAEAADFQQSIVGAVRAAPAIARPIDAVTAALTEGGATLTRWVSWPAGASTSSRRRWSCANAN
jgi:AcrR family transcriptional regulator